MKTVLSVAASLLLASSASAQAPRIGLEAGVNFSNTTFRYDDGDTEFENGDYRTGFKIGLVLDYRLSQGFYFQPGLFYSQKGSEEFLNLEPIDIRINYLELPFNFLFKAGTNRTGRFFVGAGPYVGIAIGGELDAFGDDQDLEIGNDDEDIIDRLDAGLNVTAGYEFPGGIYFRGNAAFGLTNAFSDDYGDALENFFGVDDAALRNNTYSLTLGYFIGR
ncbi:MAG TPA: porin family protein [Flavisolibacter sp.]|jgi:hypothetical protein